MTGSDQTAVQIGESRGYVDSVLDLLDALGLACEAMEPWEWQCIAKSLDIPEDTAHELKKAVLACRKIPF